MLPRGVEAFRRLHATVGDSAFFRGLRRYVEENRNATAAPGALERAMAEAAGRRLDWTLRPGARGTVKPACRQAAAALLAGSSSRAAARCRRFAARWRWAATRYAMFVAGGGAAGGDLYAVRTEGGAVVPITFSTVGEMRPALSPDGVMLAFLRGASLRDSTPGTVWVMNLLNGAEREVELPRGAGVPRQVGWSLDGRSLVVAARRRPLPIERTARPERCRGRSRPADRPAAESALAVLLGEPGVRAGGAVRRAGRALRRGRHRRTGPPGRAMPATPPGGATTRSCSSRGTRSRSVPLGSGRARRLEWDGVPPESGRGR